MDGVAKGARNSLMRRNSMTMEDKLRLSTSNLDALLPFLKDTRELALKKDSSTSCVGRPNKDLSTCFERCVALANTKAAEMMCNGLSLSKSKPPAGPHLAYISQANKDELLLFFCFWLSTLDPGDEPTDDAEEALRSVEANKKVVHVLIRRLPLWLEVLTEPTDWGKGSAIICSSTIMVALSRCHPEPLVRAGVPRVLREILQHEKYENSLAPFFLNVATALAYTAGTNEQYVVPKQVLNLLVGVLAYPFAQVNKIGKDGRKLSYTETAGALLQLTNSSRNRFALRFSVDKFLTALASPEHRCVHPQILGILCNLAFVACVREVMLTNHYAHTAMEACDAKTKQLHKFKTLQFMMSDGWQVMNDENRVGFSSTLGGVDADTGHIMLSYQWDHQETVLMLARRLQADGFRVWLDVEGMKGDILDSMAQAVDGAHVVAITLSSRYKNSVNCRLEAEYAHARKKKILPLLLAPNYQPDGWLGILCATELYYDFSLPHLFENSYQAFRNALIVLGSRMHGPDSRVVRLPTGDPAVPALITHTQSARDATTTATAATPATATADANNQRKNSLTL